MATAYTKTCTDCGAENDSNDLFCKDCGTSLAMVNSSSQQTAAFTPVSNAGGTQTPAIAPVAQPQQGTEYSSVPAAQPPAYAYTPVSQPESSRGAVLGWLAATLMLIIIAAFLYSSVISDSTRDSLTRIF